MFIDEIHGLSRVVEESLYSLLQDFKGIDRDGRIVDVPPFTMVGATTILGEVNKPFLDRFPIIIELEPLNEGELVEVIDAHSNGSEAYIGQRKALAVIELHARNLSIGSDVLIPDWIKREIARRSLGNPRIALRITRHFQAVCNCQNPYELLDNSSVNYWFSLIGIDENGLHNVDLRVVKALLERNNEPMGVTALASAAQTSRMDLEQVIEPRLEYAGFLERTPQGRMLTMKAIKSYGVQI